MNSQYIATFYSHYEAMSLKKILEDLRVKVQLSPVPRQLSSSCGTCARFEYNKNPAPLLTCEFEQLVKVKDSGYELLVDNR